MVGDAMPSPPLSTTIADLARQGFTHLELRCRCKLTHYPFRMIRGDHGRLTIEALAPRFRCRDCQHTPDPGSIRPWRQYLDCETGFGGAHRH
jgi:hypothetical protein